jgi:hypothetical protein
VVCPFAGARERDLLHDELDYQSRDSQGGRGLNSQGVGLNKMQWELLFDSRCM